MDEQTYTPVSNGAQEGRPVAPTPQYTPQPVQRPQQTQAASQPAAPQQPQYRPQAAPQQTENRQPVQRPQMQAQYRTQQPQQQAQYRPQQAQQPQYRPQQPTYQPPQQTQRQQPASSLVKSSYGRGFGIMAFVFGLLGMLFGITLPALVFGILAIAFGISGCMKAKPQRKKNDFAVAGIVMGVIAALLAIAAIVMWFVMKGAVADFEQDIMAFIEEVKDDYEVNPSLMKVIDFIIGALFK